MDGGTCGSWTGHAWLVARKFSVANGKGAGLLDKGEREPRGGYLAKKRRPSFPASPEGAGPWLLTEGCTHWAGLLGNLGGRRAKRCVRKVLGFDFSPSDQDPSAFREGCGAILNWRDWGEEEEPFLELGRG